MAELECPLDAEAPPFRVEPNGTIRIGTSRIMLDIVLGQHLDGATPEQIVIDYDTLALADVYATIAYYLRHREQMDTYLEARNREAEAIQEEIERRFPPDAWREQLLARTVPLARPLEA